MPARESRVLFISGEFPPMRGGMGDYTRELGIALASMGYEVHVATHIQARDAYHDPRVAHHLTVHPHIRRWSWRSLLELTSLVRHIGANIVHIQYQTAAYNMHPAINVFPWWARHRCPDVHIGITYHDLLVPYLFPKAGPLRRWVTFLPARAAHLVITTNAEDEHILLRAGIPSVRIPIGPNVHPIPVDEMQANAFRHRFGIPSGAHVVGYFGFLNRSKGVTELLQAIHTLVNAGRDVHLLMLGEQVGASDPTNRAYKEEVMHTIAQLGLTGRVHWTGYLDDMALSQGFAACDVVALPYRDGASLRRGTLQAALVHGAAIVTTRPRVPQGEGFDEAMYLVPPENAAALAQGIAHLLDTPDLRRELQGRASALSRRFTWDKIARRHAEAYTAILEQPAG